MKVFALMHNPCIFESAYTLVSLHMTKEGVVKAMIEEKKKMFQSKWYYHESLRYRQFKIKQ